MKIQKNFHFLNLKLKLIVGGFFLLLFGIWQSHDSRMILKPPKVVEKSPGECLEVLPAFGWYKEAIIKVSGSHCIGIDFWQQRLSNFAGHSGPSQSHNLLAIKANDVTVDLVNHTLHSDGHSSGIVAIRLDHEERPTAINITIRNGVLDLRGFGTAVEVVDTWPMYDIDTGPPKNFQGFRRTGIILENLLIKTDNVSVILEGDGNIIQKCVIESSGNSAIMMAGRKGRIINNTIILKKPIFPKWIFSADENWLYKLKEFTQYRRTPRAAIALHQATGTIISGNRIEVEGESPTRHNIYLTDASIGVRIEHNTIVGAENPVTLMMGSTAELKNNVVEKRPEQPWWPFN